MISKKYKIDGIILDLVYLLYLDHLVLIYIFGKIIH